MLGVEAPGPLHRPRAEDERAAGRAVERQRVRRRADVVVLAVLVDHHLPDAEGGRRHVDQARRSKAVVVVDVPLVPEHTGRQRGRAPGCQIRDARVAPEPHLPVGGGHSHRVVAERVDLVERPHQCVLGAAAVGGRAETRVAPRPGPRGRGVDLRRVARLLVTDERSHRRARAGDAVLPARFPEDGVAAEETEVDPGRAGVLDARPLLSGPVLVVADRQERLVVQELGAARCRVEAADVAHVVPVPLEPADHGVLAAEEPAERRVVACRVRAVVAHLVSADAADAAVGIEAVAAIVVVRLPCLVRSLEDDVGVIAVVADDEDDVAAGRALPVRPHEVCDVDAGNGVCGDLPACANAPVPAVVEVRRRVADAGGLRLRQRRARLDRRDQACAEPAVIPHSVDVDVVRRGVRLDLEGDGGAGIDALLRREALDRRVAVAGNVPLARRSAGQRVLADDRILRSRRPAAAAAAGRR